MPIKLNGATNGSVELDVPAAVGSDLQITLPATAGTAIVKAADGSVDLGSVDIDSSGNVGIGTSSPDYNLTIGDGSSYVIQNLKAASNEFCEVRFGDTASVAQGKITYDNGTDSLRFTANATERMRIDSSGRVGIGTTSAQSSLSVAGSVPNAPSTEGVHLGLTSNYAVMQLNGNTGGIIDFAEAGVDHAGRIIYTHSTDAMQFSTAASTKMTIDSTGYLYVPSMAVGGAANLHWSSGNGQFFVSSSSERFKHSISDYDKGLAELKQLQPKYFTYNDEPAQKQRAGFIAEDFHSLGLTEYVEYWNDDDGNATVPSEINYPNMVAILVKSLQEATTRIETLEAKVTTLEAG